MQTAGRRVRLCRSRKDRQRSGPEFESVRKHVSWRLGSPPATVLHIVVFVLAAVGVAALANDLATIWRIVMAIIVFAVIAVSVAPLRKWFGTPGEVIEYIGAFLGVVVIPVFALLGIDALLAHLGATPVSPAIRVIVGIVIVLVVARISLEPFWTDHEIPWPCPIAGAITFALTILPALIIGVIGQINGDGSKLSARSTVSRLDLIVLRPDPAPPTPPTTHLGSWQIDTWTGQVRGNRVVWADGRQPDLTGEADADRVLILLPPAADNAPKRWMAL